MNRSFALLSVLALGLFAQPAHAIVDLGIVLNGNMTKPNTSPASTTPSSAGLGLGFGALVNFDLGPSFSLETGLIYAAQKTNYTPTGFALDQNTKALEIPVMARYWFIPMLNLGGGLYYSSAMGDITQNTTPTGGTTTTTTLTYESQSYSKSDMGLILGAGFKMPLSGMSLVANLNYLIGLKELSDPASVTTTTKNGGLQLQAGVSFGI